jgi:hypothetical protein
MSATTARKKKDATVWQRFISELRDRTLISQIRWAFWWARHRPRVHAKPRSLCRCPRCIREREGVNPINFLGEGI